MSKEIGLAAFTSKPATQPEVAPESKKASDIKTLTIRLSRADWQELARLSVDEDTSIQALAVEGIAAVFAKRGLKWPR